MDLKVSRESGLPLGLQLVQKLRSQIESGSLRPGDRLPSVRDAAVAAGVNVNTVRAAYGRMESEGLVRSEHGRGTFVARPERARAEAEDRRELRRQIAALELELARRPLEVGRHQAPGPEAGDAPRRPPRPAILSAAELKEIRDDLYDRLRELDAERADLLRRLNELGPSEQEEPSRSHSSSSLAGARVRWVGA
ncbi:MAG TPA: GntR family transcriptional regulator [Thermoleophilaceae bacterium]|nr:GntR family transcriptional regulator [Thermoleophilaceae bacterium]